MAARYQATVAVRRQRVRRGIIYLSVLLFPVTLYYFSPFLSIMGAFDRIVTGSLIVFGVQFVAALFLGRAFCGWVCPAGGVGEMFQFVQPRRTPRWLGWVKYGIWVPWFGFVVWAFVTSPDTMTVDFIAFTTNGVSVVDPQGYIIFYAVLTIFVGLALLIGRRAGCHAICWMAPFMVIARWIRNRLPWPALRLKSDVASCIACGDCTAGCPMSIDVQEMVAVRSMEHQDCILCGNCADTCRKSVIRFSFSSGTDA